MGLQNGLGASLVDPSFDDVVAVTPSDVLTAAHRLSGVRALRCDVGGNLTLITNTVAAADDKNGTATVSGQAVQLVAATAETIQIRAAYVLATGTTATGIKAFK